MLSTRQSRTWTRRLLLLGNATVQGENQDRQIQGGSRADRTTKTTGCDRLAASWAEPTLRACQLLVGPPRSSGADEAGAKAATSTELEELRAELLREFRVAPKPERKKEAKGEPADPVPNRRTPPCISWLHLRSGCSGCSCSF